MLLPSPIWLPLLLLPLLLLLLSALLLPLLLSPLLPLPLSLFSVAGLALSPPLSLLPALSLEQPATANSASTRAASTPIIDHFASSS